MKWRSRDGMVSQASKKPHGSGDTDSSVARWLIYLSNLDEGRLAIVAFIIGAAVMLLHRPLTQLEIGDNSFYDYIAQTIVRGGIQYRDVVDIKGPGAPWLSALAMLIGKYVGLRDVTAVRDLHILMAGLLSSVTFLVANAYLRSRPAAFVAFIIPLMRDPFSEFMIGGTQPKLPMMIFGLLSLLMVIKDRPFWAGCFSMLSCLCWQPGLMFTGAAFLVFSRYLTNWRDGRAMKVLLGAAAPFALVAFYFYSKAAFGDLWSMAITYNYMVFGPEAKRGITDALAHLWKVASRVFEADVALLFLSFVGYGAYLVARVRAKLKSLQTLSSADTLKDVLLIPPAVYFIFCLINFQGGPDLIPFFPFIGIFAAYFLLVIGQWLASKTHRKPPGRFFSGGRVPAIIAFIVLLVVLFRSGSYKPEKGTIEDQDRAFSRVAAMLGPTDTIYVHGTTELLVLLNKPNLNPYLDFDWGKDDYIARQRYNGSFEALLNDIDERAPKIVALSRLRAVAHRADLEQWVNRLYDKFDVPGYDGIYIRKPQ
jgi:hypothetical protein